MVGRLCVHVCIFVCLPPFLPANFKEQAGRSQGFHNHVHDPRERERERGGEEHPQGYHPGIMKKE
jgi:hypothetical protein